MMCWLYIFVYTYFCFTLLVKIVFPFGWKQATLAHSVENLLKKTKPKMYSGCLTGPWKASIISIENMSITTLNTVLDEWLEWVTWLF